MLSCAIKGSYIPLDNPWRDSEGPLDASNVAISRIPPNTTNGIVVWMVQFKDDSKQLGTYTFNVIGIDPLEASITTQENPPGKWNSLCMYTVCNYCMLCTFFAVHHAQPKWYCHNYALSSCALPVHVWHSTYSRSTIASIVFTQNVWVHTHNRHTHWIICWHATQFRQIYLWTMWNLNLSE